MFRTCRHGFEARYDIVVNDLERRSNLGFTVADKPSMDWTERRLRKWCGVTSQYYRGVYRMATTRLCRSA